MESRKKPLDLSTLDTVAASNDGATIELYNPVTNDDLGITVTVLGRDSAEYNRVQAEQSRRRLSKMQKAGGFKSLAISPEEIDADAIDLLSACTKAWDGLVFEGVELPCTRENVKMIYTRLPWIREQIDQAIGDRANFIRG